MTLNLQARNEEKLQAELSLEKEKVRIIYNFLNVKYEQFIVGIMIFESM